MKKFFAILAMALILPLSIVATACTQEPEPPEVKYDYVVVSEETETNYTTFAEAVSATKSGDKIVLHKDAEIDSMLTLTYSLTIDGQNEYTIKNSDSFEFVGNKSEVKNDAGNIKAPNFAMIYCKTADVTLTLKNVTLNANNKCRVAFFSAGKLVVDGATLTGGNNAGFSDSAGVFMTSASSFEMTSGKIYGNTVVGSRANDNYLQYTADLWIGANVTAKISGGEIDNIFANANSYSASNKGSVTVDGGTMTTIYIEYDGGYGADLHFVNGTITNLYVSKTESNGAHYTLNAQEGYSYVGGSETPVAIEPQEQA